MKVSIVAYEDNDPNNEKGPINSAVFNICWEKHGKPQDFWAFEEKESMASTVENNRKHTKISAAATERGTIRQPAIALTRNNSYGVAAKVF